jgi:hypothetical protein
MNPDLYKSEFRDFKYLKSSATDIAYYKKSALELNGIQPWAQTNDPTFVWPCRLEFIEQLFDLKNDTVYIVEPGNLYPVEHRKNSYDYEDARLYTIEKPVIVHGNPFLHPEKLRNILAEEDIPRILNPEENYHFFVCSNNENDPGQVVRINDIGLLPSPLGNLTAVFYDKGWAEKYQKAVTDYLRKSNDAVSAISRLF